MRASQFIINNELTGTYINHHLANHAIKKYLTLTNDLDVALNIASEIGNLSIANESLRRGAMPTYVHVCNALYNNDVEMLDLLVSFGFHLNRLVIPSIAQIAVEYNYISIIQYLDRTTYVPPLIVGVNDRFEIVDYLLRNGYYPYGVALRNYRNRIDDLHDLMQVNPYIESLLPKNESELITINVKCN